jgi:hypothetical protein
MDRRQSEKLLKTWQGFLGLNHWDLELQVNEEENWDRYGQCACVQGQKRAVITLWNGLNLDKAEDTVVHELLHVVLDPLATLLEQWQNQLSEDQKKLYADQFDQSLEQTVYHLAKVLQSMKE